MRKSSATLPHYRHGSSQNAGSLATFREQMADYARAERLRELRRAKHLSRERVASEIGVSTKTLYAWENGAKIKWENAQKAGAFYGVDPETLVSRASSSEGVAGEEPEEQLDRIEAKLDELLDLARTIDPAAITEPLIEDVEDQAAPRASTDPAATDNGAQSDVAAGEPQAPARGTRKGA